MRPPKFGGLTHHIRLLSTAIGCYCFTRTCGGSSFLGFSCGVGQNGFASDICALLATPTPGPKPPNCGPLWTILGLRDSAVRRDPGLL